MLTITQLAKQCEISRATVLYYEEKGLLIPAYRSENGYRWFGDLEVKRLKDILQFRAFGVSVADISNLLEPKSEAKQTELLLKQFNQIELNISELRKQQNAIIALLKQPKLLEKNMVTKQRWVEIMKASGFSEEDMTSWHKNFEKMEPEEHQKFLESLGIEDEEIKQIRSL